MDFEKNDNGEDLVVKLSGELDAMNAPELEQQIKDRLDGIKRLEFDLSGLNYVSSAGLRVFLSMQKLMRAQGSMVVRNAGEDVMDIFKVSGFTKLLNIQ